MCKEVILMGNFAFLARHIQLGWHFQPAYGCFFNVRDGAVLKNKRTCPEGSYGLFLTYGKKTGLVTHIHTHDCYDHDFGTRFVSSHTLLHTYLSS
jgi:hypothetical protein